MSVCDKKKTFCVYDGPDQNAIRRTASQNGLPVDHITEVSVLDPYYYRYVSWGEAHLN